MTGARRDPGDQIADVVGVVRDVLGEAAIGAYLHGSTATGRLQSRSDIDVLVLAARPSTLAEKRRLIDRLLAISGSADASGRSRSIELTIVVHADVRPWRYPPRFDFQYGDWLRAEFRRGDLTPWDSPNPDVAVLVTMALEANRAVFGPAPADVFDPVPPGDLEAAIVAGIPGLLEDLDRDTANVVLTIARIWVTLAAGRIDSKDAAADWALDRLPAARRAVLARARAVYVGEADDRWGDLRPEIRPHVDAMLAAVGAVRPGS